MEFAKAVRRQAKARIGLMGPSGSGKTWGALLIAAGLGESIAVIDTERGSASLYAGAPGMPEFLTLELPPPYSPERFIEAIKAAAAAGVGTLIVDSATHEWSGSGGCLEINDTVAAAKFRGNGWAAWNETTPRHRRFIDAMLGYPGHVIVTLRSKTDTAQEEKNGRKTVVKLGMKAETRDGFEFEMTTVLDIVHAGHFALASKDRTGLFSGGEAEPISITTGQRLRAWLESGAEPLPNTPADAAPGAALPPEKIDTRLSQTDFDMMLNAIKAAADMKALRAHFGAAFTAATEANDAEAIAEFGKAKDARKSQLEAASARVAA